MTHQAVALLVEFALGAEVLEAQVLHLLLLGKDVVFALDFLFLGQIDHVGFVLLVHLFCLRSQCLNLGLPALADLVELLVGHLILRNLLQDIIHVDKSILLGEGIHAAQQGKNACDDDFLHRAKGI